jgi:hypothetical protein
MNRLAQMVWITGEDCERVDHERVDRERVDRVRVDRERVDRERVDQTAEWLPLRSDFDS